MKLQALARLLSLAGAYTEDRLTREQAKKLALQLRPLIKRHCQGFQLAGSYRRGKTDIGDLDFVVVNCDMAALLSDLVEHAAATEAPRAGSGMLTVTVPFGKKSIQVEFVNVKPRAIGSGLLHSTGGADFNKGLRSYAKSKGMLLNQHGLFRADNKRFLAGRTEEDVFDKLGWAFVPPKERGFSFMTLKPKYLIDPYKNNLLLKKPQGEGKVWKVKSKSDPNKLYFVTLKPNGKWTCTCPQFVFRKVDCKHIDLVKERTGTK
jgi:hypothetical protein